MTMEDVRVMLKEEVDKAGGQRPFAKKHGIFHSQVGRVLRGEDKPEPAVILALGLRRVLTYEKRSN